VGRWEEGEQVSLAEELLAIHARIQAERERRAPGGEEVFRCVVNIRLIVVQTLVLSVLRSAHH